MPIRTRLTRAARFFTRSHGYESPAPPEATRRRPRPAAALSSLELAESLLKHGANPNVRIAWQEIPFDRDDGEVKSPPNIRVGRDYISLVGATPFYLAAKNGDVELMRLLVKHGSRPAADHSAKRDAAHGSGRVRNVGWRNTRTIERNT